MSTEPLIFSADSGLFESSDSHAPAPLAPFDAVIGKESATEELSSHLPSYFGDVDGATSPFGIHSSVLDSVFSTSADDSQAIDHTPMFDELDLIVDGAKPNSKDDWVSLFGEDDKLLHSNEPTTSLQVLSPSVPSTQKRFYSEIEETFEFSPAKPVVTESEPFTRTPSQSIQPAPVINGPPPQVKEVSNNISKTKTSQSGAVNYNKKPRTQPLPPVDVKTSDPVLLKRARNTEAARRSRARKMERMAQLEESLDICMKEKGKLETEVSRLQELLKSNGIAF